MAARRKGRPSKGPTSGMPKDRRCPQHFARGLVLAIAAAAMAGLFAPAVANAMDVDDGSSPAPAKLVGPPGVPGIDVSAYQHSVDWQVQAAAGIKFTYVLATEGNYASNKYFHSQYSGAQAAGLLVGSYHYANPAVSTGASQAQYFVDHGGGWTADGNTLPPVLDLEDDPYNKNICYQLDPAQIVDWIKSFSTEIALLTGQKPVIYTTSKWWSKCTADSTAFASQPLFLAKYADTPGAIPKGWSRYTFWQYSEKRPASAPGVVGDLDVFNGPMAALQTLAGPAKPLFTTGPAINPLYPPMPSPLAAIMTQTPLLAAKNTPGN